MSGGGDAAGEAGQGEAPGTDPTSESSEAQNGELQPGTDEADADAGGARELAQDLEEHNEPSDATD